jgi:hypothetical protein
MLFLFKMHFDSDTRSKDETLDAIAYTLNNRRSRFGWRAWAVIDSESQLKELEYHVSKPTKVLQKLALGFVFSG